MQQVPSDEPQATHGSFISLSARGTVRFPESEQCLSPVQPHSGRPLGFSRVSYGAHSACFCSRERYGTAIETQPSRPQKRQSGKIVVPALASEQAQILALTLSWLSLVEGTILAEEARREGWMLEVQV